MLSICCVHVNLLSIVTPRNLVLSSLGNVPSGVSILMGFFYFLRPKACCRSFV